VVAITHVNVLAWHWAQAVDAACPVRRAKGRVGLRASRAVQFMERGDGFQHMVAGSWTAFTVRWRLAFEDVVVGF